MKVPIRNDFLLKRLEVLAFFSYKIHATASTNPRYSKKDVIRKPIRTVLKIEICDRESLEIKTAVTASAANSPKSYHWRFSCGKSWNANVDLASKSADNRIGEIWIISPSARSIQPESAKRSELKKTNEKIRFFVDLKIKKVIIETHEILQLKPTI